MPYGVDRKVGGDSKENVNWMERCVTGISGKNKRTGKPYTEGEKIAICKAQLKKNKEKRAALEEVIVDEDVIEKLHETESTLIKKVIENKRVSGELQAEELFSNLLIKSNYDLDLLSILLF